MIVLVETEPGGRGEAAWQLVVERQLCGREREDKIKSMFCRRQGRVGNVDNKLIQMYVHVHIHLTNSCYQM